MPAADTHYFQFQLLYEDGLRRLAKVQLPPDSWTAGAAANRALSVVDEALGKMSGTKFGDSLLDTAALTESFQRLNHDLGRWVDAAISARVIKDTAPVAIWAAEDCYEAERRLRFFGEVGALYHHFRDIGRSLDILTEREIRRRYLKDSAALIQHLDDMLDYVGLHLVYKPIVVRRMEAVAHALKTLNLDMASPKDSTVAGKNPLHSGHTIIRRQFARSASLLCFELFGCMSTRVLDDFLELKSTTAEKLGLEAWAQAMAQSSRPWKAREYINQALTTGLSVAPSRNWVTLPVLAYFAEHRREALDD